MTITEELQVLIDEHDKLHLAFFKSDAYLEWEMMFHIVYLVCKMNIKPLKLTIRQSRDQWDITAAELKLYTLFTESMETDRLLVEDAERKVLDFCNKHNLPNPPSPWSYL